MKSVWILYLIFRTIGGDYGVVMSQIPGTTYAEQYQTEQACKDDMRKFTSAERTPKNVIKVTAFCTAVDKPEAQ